MSKLNPSTTIFLGSLTDDGYYFFPSPSQPFSWSKTLYSPGQCSPYVKLPMKLTVDSKFDLFFIFLLFDLFSLVLESVVCTLHLVKLSKYVVIIFTYVNNSTMPCHNYL